MQFAIFVKATADSEAGTLPSKDLLDAMGRFNDELIAAGVLKDAAGLQPSRDGKRVRFDGASRSVVDGPFTATDELVAGYWIWDLPSIDEAVAWVKRCPNPMPGSSEIEIRPVIDPAEFGEEIARDHEARLQRADAAGPRR